MSQANDFNETFEEYHSLIRKEIAKDTDLEIKLAKVEQLVFILDSLVSDRFGEEYIKDANKIRKILKAGSYFDKEFSREVLVNYNQPGTMRRRLDLLREWLSLMLKEHIPFKLNENLNKVDFGDN